MPNNAENRIEKEPDPDPCPICEKHLSSIITRRIGDIAVCADCGDKLIPLMNALGEGVVNRCMIVVKEGRSINRAIRLIVSDNYLVPEQHISIIDASL